MARIHFIIVLIVILLLTSCGQVGTITGGEKDTVSPRIIVENVQPPFGSTNVSPQEIMIPFNEFIALNKPAENIQVTPADVNLDYSIKKKTVVLKVKDGSWMPNTTYTIYLNHAVKDITESNDSIIAYVFSTGDFLDSLQTAVQVNDAYTSKPLEGVTVGLYTTPLINDTGKVEPRYYASTNKEGIAAFRNIKDASFYAYAFNDENRNNRLDATEKRAALGKAAVLDTLFEVGPVIRLMPPLRNRLQILSNEVRPTANWSLGFNRSLKENEWFEFLYPQPNYVIWNSQGDSLTAFYEYKNNSGEFSGVLHTAELNDTISKKFFFKEKAKLKIKTNLENKQLRYSDTLKVILNEPLQSVNTAMILLSGIEFGDSVKRPLIYSLDTISPIELGFYFERGKQEKLFLNIPPAAIKGINYALDDSLNLDFTLQKEKETGTMIVAFDTVPQYGILYVTNKTTNKVINVVFDGAEKKTHQIDYLAPGQYSFHYLLDEDKNGKWSTGSIFSDKEAEEIIWFAALSTIRANWEVKTTLSIEYVKKEEKAVTSE
jgi:hypothetical protein